MIYTLTLNPAIDYVAYVDRLSVGSIGRSHNERIFFGGKGINASCILKEHGIPSVAMGFIAGFTGDAIEKGLAAQGIQTDFVHLQNGFTRINVKLRSEGETDINGEGPAILESDVEKLYSGFMKLKDGDTLVLAGSIPSSLPDNIYESIMKRLSEKAVHFVVDAAGELLINTLKYKPFLIKPNNDELGEIFGVTVKTSDQALLYASRLQAMGARNVLVSMGSLGAALLDEHGKTHIRAAYKGKAVNTVGAGDSMVAGFIAGYEQSGDYAYALKLGSASGSATAFSEGLADFEKIQSVINSEK